jgi:aerobic carbon-monoxide dehydrogenase small subunit
MDAMITLTVNNQQRTITTDVRRPLLDVLREDFQLTGAKYGCGEGRCGACVVLVAGKRTFSCRVPIAEVAEKSVTTIEGLASGDTLHPVQQVFLDESAMQCGYCTAGMILGAVALLDEKPQATDEEITGWMNRQLCRCCGYPAVIAAVQRAAGRPQS